MSTRILNKSNLGLLLPDSTCVSIIFRKKNLQRIILLFKEALWQQALDDIQREIETKLDKMELSPVKDFFNNKLKQLQENLKQIASLRREVEAAGAKKKLMR